MWGRKSGRTGGCHFCANPITTTDAAASYEPAKFEATKK